MVHATLCTLGCCCNGVGEPQQNIQRRSDKESGTFSRPLTKGFLIHLLLNEFV